MSNFIPNQIKRNITKGNIIIKDIRNLFRKKKKDNDIKYRIIRDLRTLFETEEDHYEPVAISNAFDDNFFEYESNGDKGKTLSIEEYLNEIRPYLSNMINDFKTQGYWKIQLTIAINFLSSKDTNKTRTMHSHCENEEIMIGNETDEIIQELFDSFLQKYQKGLEESMKGREFVFDGVDLLHYKFHKISLNRVGLYLDSPKWFKKQKSNNKSKK